VPEAPIAIDIKPGSDTNPIRPFSRAVILHDGPRVGGGGGLMLAEIPQDFSLARSWLRPAADYGDATAQGPGEVPADLLARLSRTGLAGGPTSRPEGQDGAETALGGAERHEGEPVQKHEAPETLRFRAL